MLVYHLAAYRIFEKKPPPKARKVKKGKGKFKKGSRKVTVIEVTLENGSILATPPPKMNRQKELKTY